VLTARLDAEGHAGAGARAARFHQRAQRRGHVLGALACDAVVVEDIAVLAGMPDHAHAGRATREDVVRGLREGLLVHGRDLGAVQRELIDHAAGAARRLVLGRKSGRNPLQPRDAADGAGGLRRPHRQGFCRELKLLCVGYDLSPM
jgi:hypothetical protein